MYEQDGALWFRSTTFGDDKDRVIYRSNGEPTYFAADIGYVTEKFSRGFDHLIYIWGADHHGTVARVRNAAKAMGYDRRGRPGAALFVGPLRARRRGDPDVQAGRASSSRSTSCSPRSASTPRAGSSPHARHDRHRLRHRAGASSSRTRTRSTTCSTRTRGSPRSCARPPRPAWRRRDTVDGTLAAGPRRRLPATSCRSRRSSRTRFAEETHGITAYATELATAFHAYYRDPRVVDPDDPERSATGCARRATQLTLARTLGLLGISAPESM